MPETCVIMAVLPHVYQVYTGIAGASDSTAINSLINTMGPTAVNMG